MAHLGCASRSGSESAKREKPILEECRKIYKDVMAQGTASQAQGCATKIIRRAIDQHTNDTVKALAESEDNSSPQPVTTTTSTGSTSMAASSTSMASGAKTSGLQYVGPSPLLRTRGLNWDYQPDPSLYGILQQTVKDHYENFIKGERGKLKYHYTFSSVEQEQENRVMHRSFATQHTRAFLKMTFG
ncbi:hypothetical protein BGZ49_010649 [Haplosporangium sp. Z 27]|nr:hypothetical protein BGZ49_010649 [Haplosporangium sp. Z 27]